MPPEPVSPLDRLRAWWRQPVIRQRLRIAGIVLLLAGVAWSVVTLDLSLSDLSLSHLALNVLVLTPAALILAAWTFRVTAASAGVEVKPAQAISTVAHANVAEILPIPGGALVRGAALVDAGVRVGLATKLVLQTALLTLALTLVLGSGALALLDQAVWFWLTGACVITVLAILAWMSRHVAPRYLASMVGLRLISLFVAMIRLVLAFAILGQTITILDGALYVVAPTLGAAVGIFPAGLGLNEALAAGLATLIGGSPATAFLAVGVDRVLFLSVGAVFVTLRSLVGGQRA